ncbi:MAG: hypothetical protein ACD_50C00391G0004 [uncultured bacterium]|nr:MAG: hypothetical protein ACD_50C00391G0004 [uncultured bacterium]OGH13407.1 MAG: hypothetical protein A2687_02580 [Candidatus Levybacteria bacterium RIFCSPHIGHO2_01_FULL_38_26]
MESIKPKPELHSIQPSKRGIQGLVDALSPESSYTKPILMTDLDDTIIEPEKLLWTDGKYHRVFPETAAALMAVNRSGVSLGVVTEQSFTQLEPTLYDVAKIALGEGASIYDLYNGPVIGEGGGVGRRGSGRKQGELVVMTPPQAREDRKKILKWLKINITKGNPNDSWGHLSGVNPEIGTQVQLPDAAQGIATITLWEKGPHVTKDPSYIVRYNNVQTRVNEALNEFGITSLETYEAGIGSLRIVPKGMNKARTVGLLAGIGAFDRNRMGFACDGPNDVKFARELRAKGGAVIAVGNAVPELHEIADYSAKEHSGRGFAEAISQIFPQQYEQSIRDLHKRGLSLIE